MKIRKAIIPAAGLGTRFLPATKAMPKEMLPIVDKPTIQYIVEEAIESGIEDIIIVTGKGKRAIEDHFDHSFELEQILFEKGKLEILEEVQKSSNMVDIHYIRQKEPKGLGHAIWCARKFIGDEPFAVLLGDDIVRSNKPCLKQLMEQYEEYERTILGIKQIEYKEVTRYGIIDGINLENQLYRIKRLIEKPRLEESPSNLAIMGRYILKPTIFDILGSLKPGAGGEIQLTDALDQLNQREEILGFEFEGIRYDVGEKLGFIKTNIEMALQIDDLKKELLDFLSRTIAKQLIK
ncbi:UTP--glucose-1-phosphate uridylyltransferase GalU [Heyndrickxia oleronia]|jgi:UTP--glucose-1-phosphate uridylyltransferase|uniref:UTP--glucose-1-phosphate uridylyltransferase n=1 Tax=Heyndrickxia oleronia TaxID=38875 RepID=A0A8E2I3K8_9BACI|nr:UTP--glucose-1-phosphate uridylyltransferase GalU [Heyndrickxia oleronia]MBU5210432.1 UTP--glucose-1-phosphate uridylyltransferase GalU [Heyndrickxia oleronia]MCI1590668.1 UTP--glucose-1-phosphate uridylyltransferase GalU [Heyndrickxia oleronia]MCI1612143.1 UTP--glucose-1-phosphate uridylyltransferase GalU [Heyndrickxia oleronia]MCI1759853.1 UTP--glucose-1-phosphate uridylyltransferase GalU [Heyndrickxia oleronia]MEC1374174.1 UTP--glucose-1-phosphate uridylyltransferase GalU [Heyndrickxia o